ncbi:RNA-directed DNA polymerase, eukaryota, reverse transcriptase zinc-binding domain protein [Tanacetum coccineum]
MHGHDKVIRSHKAQFFGIQETMLDHDNYTLFASIWGSNNFDFHHNPAIGNWMGCIDDVIVANIYALQDLASKKDLWKNLLTTLDRKSGLWVMFDDFNSVRLSDDRKGFNFLQIDADVFNEFIHRSVLVEFQMGGRQFIRISRDGAKLSKLDRFFVSL